MKSVFNVIVTLGILAVTTVGCSKEAETADAARALTLGEKNIVGTWNLKCVEYSYDGVKREVEGYSTEFVFDNCVNSKEDCLANSTVTTFNVGGDSITNNYLFTYELIDDDKRLITTTITNNGEPCAMACTDTCTIVSLDYDWLVMLNTDGEYTFAR